MPSFTCRPRVEFDPDHYPRLRVWDPRAGQERYVYLHRLVAFAHGELEDLWEPLHVHHQNGDRWDNRPANLEALHPDEHDEAHGTPVVREGGEV